MGLDSPSISRRRFIKALGLLTLGSFSSSPLAKQGFGQQPVLIDVKPLEPVWSVINNDFILVDTKARVCNNPYQDGDEHIISGFQKVRIGSDGTLFVVQHQDSNCNYDILSGLSYSSEGKLLLAGHFGTTYTGAGGSFLAAKNNGGETADGTKENLVGTWNYRAIDWYSRATAEHIRVTKYQKEGKKWEVKWDSAYNAAYDMRVIDNAVFVVGAVANKPVILKVVDGTIKRVEKMSDISTDWEAYAYGMYKGPDGYLYVLIQVNLKQGAFHQMLAKYDQDLNRVWLRKLDRVVGGDFNIHKPKVRFATNGLYLMHQFSGCYYYQGEPAWEHKLAMYDYEGRLLKRFELQDKNLNFDKDRTGIVDGQTCSLLDYAITSNGTIYSLMSPHWELAKGDPYHKLVRKVGVLKYDTGGKLQELRVWNLGKNPEITESPFSVDMDSSHLYITGAVRAKAPDPQRSNIKIDISKGFLLKVRQF